MKKAIVIIGLLLFSSLSFAYEKTYLTLPSNNYYRPYSYNNYNPYSRYNVAKDMYYSPYRYLRYNANDPKRIKRLRNIMRLQRLRNNFLSWDTIQRFNPKNNGSLTGYSVPVTNDIYDQMGITPYDPKKSKQNTRSTTKYQELYSMPQGDETYYRNGQAIRDLGGVSGKTGVTVIYD